MAAKGSPSGVTAGAVKCCSNLEYDGRPPLHERLTGEWIDEVMALSRTPAEDFLGVLGLRCLDGFAACGEFP